MTNQSPSDLGYRMPAEWEPHARTWMGWPERPDNWRLQAVPAQKAFVDVASAISQFEPVIVCANKSQIPSARAMLPTHIDVIELPQDDAWFRDTGPTFITRKNSENTIEDLNQTSIAGVDWNFNAWGGALGGLYPDWKRDKAVASTILTKISRTCFPCHSLVLEGGSITTDGQGTLLTTEECLLNPNRNPTLTKNDIESHLKCMLGISKIIWLPRGLYGDVDTNGHVDNFACFARPGTILLAWTDDENDPQFERSAEALSLLSSEADARGRSFEVVKLPLPPPMYSTKEDVESVHIVHGVVVRKEGTRLPASYNNLYICNGGVVMPGFGICPAADERARKVVAEAFPDRTVVQVLSREVVLGGGCIHCITQNEPA